MSEPAGGGGGGTIKKSKSKSPTPSRYNTSTHVRTMRNQSRLPANVMNTIASHFDENWWEPVLRQYDALGIAYDRFLFNRARPLYELPAPLEDPASIRFRGTEIVLAAYVAFLTSKKFKEFYGVESKVRRIRLVNDLMCKIRARSYDEFKMTFDAGVDVKTFNCYDNSLTEHLLQQRSYDKFIYAAEHGVDVVDPIIMRKLVNPDGKTLRPHAIFGSSIKQILTAPRTHSCLAVLYMLVRHPELFTDTQYDTLHFSTGAMKNALLTLQKMLADGDIRKSFAADALSPKGERFRHLVANTIGDKAGDAIISVFGRHRRLGTAAHLLQLHKTRKNIATAAYLATKTSGK